MLLVATLMVPVADSAAFGIHDHISGQDTLTGEASDPGRSHHCELGMSPGMLPLAHDPPALDRTAVLAMTLPPQVPSVTPSVPVSPPRS